MTQAIPHGIDSGIFYPRDRRRARLDFGYHVFGEGQQHIIKSDEFLVGIIATNQPRKDWPLAFETVSILRIKHNKNVRLWIHTDALERYWSIPTLAQDYGLSDCSWATLSDLTDDQLAWGYSACDVTLGIGRGEGFGLPLAESLACGTPVIHGAYGGALDWMPKPFLVQPCAYNHEGLYADKRPVFSAEAWAEAAVNARREDAKLPPCLEWKTLWKEFENWFRQGLK